MEKQSKEVKEFDKTQAEKKYPGAAVDVADGEKVTAEAVKQETAQMNNNPRNDA